MKVEKIDFVLFGFFPIHIFIVFIIRRRRLVETSLITVIILSFFVV